MEELQAIATSLDGDLRTAGSRFSVAITPVSKDVVMETTTEMWPRCPMHDHFLRSEPDGDWVAWKCPESRESMVRFGELASPTA